MSRRGDATDERILRLLVRHARASYRQVGAAAGLSADAVAQRVRRLEGAGVIRGCTALLDPALDSPVLLAVVHVRVSVDAVRAAPGVTGFETRPVLRHVLRR